jgi:hypothetical protein
MGQKEVEYFQGKYPEKNVLVDIATNTALGNGQSRTAFGELAVAELQYQAGWSFPYQINPSAIRSTVINGGVISHTGSFAQLETGTDPNGVAFLRTNAHIVYNPGIGTLVRFTAIFGTPQPDSIQLIGIGDTSDGWFFGYDGTKFGILRRNAGVDTWEYQENWNKDKYETLNPQLLNVYEINVQWLGGGAQDFSIERTRGELSIVHRIEYANLYTDVSVDIPNLPISAGVANLGNTSNITLKTPSAGGGSQGEAYPTELTSLVGYERNISIPSGVATYAFGIQAPSTYLGKDNRLYGEFEYLTVTTDGTKEVTLRVIFGATLTAPVWTDIEPGISHLQYDESATAYTGGIEVVPLQFGKVDSKDINIRDVFDAKIWPDNNIILIAESDGASSLTFGLTLRSRN